MKSRQKAQLRESLSKRLTGYATAAGAAGIGLLAAAQPASADIIYTPANISMVPGTPGAPTTVPIDLNHDGVVDFNFFDWATGSLAGLSIGINRTAGTNGAFWGYQPFALKAGARIGSAYPGKFWTYGGMMALVSNDGNQGSWPNVTNRFLGLFLSVNGQDHYGWAELNVVAGRSAGLPFVDATLLGYAYDTVANQTILAGQTSSTPEPATLGLLALGSLGLAFRRRRKAATVEQDSSCKAHGPSL
ncbi:MAG TPA: PEP-CTERM sorting domain-containing protein [Terriglobia bacterium]